MPQKTWLDIVSTIIQAFGVILPFVLGILIGFFTRDYQMEQVSVSKLEVMEKFIPHISDSPKRREVALVTLAQLGYEKEALGFENLYDDEETKSAITVIRAGSFKTKDNLGGSFTIPKGKINEKEE